MNETTKRDSRQTRWGFELPDDYGTHDDLIYLLKLEKSGIKFYDQRSRVVINLLDPGRLFIYADLIPLVHGKDIVGCGDPKHGDSYLGDMGRERICYTSSFGCRRFILN